MGLNYASLLLLKKTELIRASASYGLDDRQNRATKCLMFGRAKVSLSSNQAKQAAEQLELPLENLTGWSERLLMDLGCTEVDSLDFSSFEGAKIIWNLNSLLNTTQTYEAFQGKYDLILDYGTAEHVFTPSASLANAIYLLRDGGRINYMLPVCGWCDHGFYQFSPTYFYSLEVNIHCSKGTYIRQLAEDIGKHLNSPACLINLERRAISDIKLTDAISFKELEKLVKT